MSVAHIEAKIDLGKPADRELKAGIDQAFTPFKVAKQRTFGVRLSSWTRGETTEEPISASLIKGLLDTGLQSLRSQQQALQKNRPAEAMNTDIVMKRGQITITDFERALEFLSPASERRSPEAFLKVMNALITEAKENPGAYADMKRRRPSTLFPEGVLTAPIFGFADQGIWDRQRQSLIKDVQNRIGEIEQFIQSHLEDWANGDKEPELPFEARKISVPPIDPSDALFEKRLREERQLNEEFQ